MEQHSSVDQVNSEFMSHLSTCQMTKSACIDYMRLYNVNRSI